MERPGGHTRTHQCRDTSEVELDAELNEAGRAVVVQGPEGGAVGLPKLVILVALHSRDVVRRGGLPVEVRRQRRAEEVRGQYAVDLLSVDGVDDLVVERRAGGG